MGRQAHNQRIYLPFSSSSSSSAPSPSGPDHDPRLDQDKNAAFLSWSFFSVSRSVIDAPYLVSFGAALATISSVCFLFLITLSLSRKGVRSDNSAQHFYFVQSVRLAKISNGYKNSETMHKCKNFYSRYNELWRSVVL